MKKSNFSPRFLQKIFSLFLIFSILGIGSITLSAQVQISDLIQGTNIDLLETPTTSSTSNLHLFQVGQANKIEIYSNQDFQYNPQNQAILQQYGYDNSMNILSNNPNGIINLAQEGTNNQINLIGEGANLKLTHIQQGNNNLINQSILGSADVDMTLIQSGDNHNLEQTINSQSAIEMTIIQKGQNAGIIIKNY